jgi:hypothetical protein
MVWDRHDPGILMLVDGVTVLAFCIQRGVSREGKKNEKDGQKIIFAY